MGHMIQSLKERMNKYFLLLLATTILLGVIGWLLPVGKEESNYSLETSFTLGKYGKPDLNDPKRVINLLTPTKSPFYKDHLKDLWKEKLEDISTNLHVTVGQDNLIYLSYSDQSLESTAQVLNEITSAFMASEQDLAQEEQKFIQHNIDEITNEKVASEAKVEDGEFFRLLTELKTAQHDIKPAKIFKPVDIDINAINTENRAFNSKERAVLGVLLGVTLSFLWIVFPVIFRERSY